MKFVYLSMYVVPGKQSAEHVALINSLPSGLAEHIIP